MMFSAEIERCFRAPLLRCAQSYLGSAEEAEDAVQDVLARACSSAEAAREPRAWLYRCLRHRCLNALRARARRPDGAPLPSAEPPADATRLLSRLVRAEEHAELGRWLARLPAGEREALLLRYVEDLSRDEIARVLDLPPATVKTRLFAGLERLRGMAGAGPA